MLQLPVLVREDYDGTSVQKITATQQIGVDEAFLVRVLPRVQSQTECRAGKRYIIVPVL
jgi:hypothetical protein